MENWINNENKEMIKEIPPSQVGPMIRKVAFY